MLWFLPKGNCRGGGGWGVKEGERRIVADAFLRPLCKNCSHECV